MTMNFRAIRDSHAEMLSQLIIDRDDTWDSLQYNGEILFAADQKIIDERDAVIDRAQDAANDWNEAECRRYERENRY